MTTPRAIVPPLVARRVPPWLLVLLVPIACGGDGNSTPLVTPEPPAAPVVAQVQVTPANATIVPGGTVTLNGQPVTATGAAVNATISWSSSAPTVATVDGSGRVTGVATGQATITATAGAGSGRATITVLIPVASVTLDPDSLVIATGDTSGFTPIVRDAAGSILTGREIGWGTSEPSIATVSATGTVTGIAAGRALIIASSEGKADTATVRVVIPETRLVFDRIPLQVRPGMGLGLVVRATRTGVDTLRSFNGVVTIQDEKGMPSLLGTSTAVARNGLASFDDLAISTAGTYRVRASASALSPVTSAPIVVNAASTLPTITIGTIQRTTVTVGVQGSSRYRIPVTLRDSAGPIATPTPVRVVVARGPGAIVSGATTVTTTAGAATFELVIEGTAGIDLEISAPGFQSRTQAIDSPSQSQTNTLLQRNTADSVVAVGGRLTLSATLTHAVLASAPVHATSYELSWNPAQVTLTSDSATTSASYTINRSTVAEGVLRVSVAGTSPIAALGASALLQRFTLAVRDGATGVQQVRLTTLTYLGPSGESLATRRTSDVSFRVP